VQVKGKVHRTLYTMEWRSLMLSPQEAFLRSAEICRGSLMKSNKIRRNVPAKPHYFHEVIRKQIENTDPGLQALFL
jgi:hypothetical protein